MQAPGDVWRALANPGALGFLNPPPTATRDPDPLQPIIHPPSPESLLTPDLASDSLNPYHSLAFRL